MKNIAWIMFLCLVSCTMNRSEKEALLKGQSDLNLDESAQLKFSELFDTVEYVPLETNDTFLLGYIDRPKLVGKSIYFISDKSFYQFDTETGKGKLKISRLGLGPEEYQSLFDACVDSASGNVELLDNNHKQIQVYDSKGQYVRSLPLPFMPFGFAKQGENDYWFYNNNLISDVTRSKLVRYDMNSNRITEELFPIDEHIASYFFVVDANNFTSTPSGLYYMASPSDTIYRLGSGAVPVYTLGLGKYSVPQDFWNKQYADIMEFVTKANEHDYIYSLTNFSLNDQAIMVAFMLREQLYWSFYSMDNRSAYTACHIYDDFNFTTGIKLSTGNIPYAMDNNYFYCFITAEQFVGLAEKAKNPQIKRLIEEHKLDEQANPVLMKCKLKIN